ncbi:solute carrier family 15 member 2 [Periophthalmus magnuspinnatus]|uniref:solute carrier family 15 member 2 n=1 Tax=Periophthalmus magnuspinnatus TaxID=409849 RepID=UPI00145A47DC|nr:solute carrier family 15 member 2 [Periophthalmus magnuspinnatus]
MPGKLCGTNYPTSICFIVVNEFCERFSYYGMKAVLTLYFLSYLHWDKDLSTAIYHAFSSLCYFTPILGAIIADSWLGKFKTIIYLSIVYVIGHVVKSVGAIPTVGDTNMHIALSMIGLILIAFGTGGIKPCVAAFGGDQFDEEHVSERQKFFSVFYMSINAGSLLSTIITPILRSDVQCFGGDCYALAFGVPAALMVVALVVFIGGSGMYKRNPPQGNVLLEVCNCIGFAIKNRWRSSKNEAKRKHWLDWAEDKYSKRLIQEVKMVLRVLVLYIPLPMFWALFDQQGSRWTLQATRMNLAFGPSFTIEPDQMQMLNALLILVFVPIFDLIIYPLIGCCKISITPLRKMATGMIFAALAFGAATVVEINVVKTVVSPAPAQKALLQVLNVADRDITVTLPNQVPPLGSFQVLQDPEYMPVLLHNSSAELNFLIDSNGVNFECIQTVNETTANSLIVYSQGTGLTCKLVEDHIEKSGDGKPLLRFLNNLSEDVKVTVDNVDFEISSGFTMSKNQTVSRGVYSSVELCLVPSNSCSNLDLGLLDFGASYTYVIYYEKDSTVAVKRTEDVEANNVHVAWQIPQYVLMTAGEVMFSITGLEFSYSQSPANMKSVLQAGWLLTVAFGNVIVLIVAEGAGLEQWKEFVLFAGLLLFVCVIFSIMAVFYTYVDPEEMDKVYMEDSKYGSMEKKRRPSDNLQMNRKGKSTKL